MEIETTKINFNFLLPTIIFCIVGLFIPGITVLILIEIQSLLTHFGFECTKVWNLMWIISWIGMLASPILFIKYLKKSNLKRTSLRINLMLFNFLEYVFIQVAFASLLSNEEMLCYGTDGQNGLEFVFTAWLSLPILFIFSLIYNYIFKSRQNKFKEFEA